MSILPNEIIILISEFIEDLNTYYNMRLLSKKIKTGIPAFGCFEFMNVTVVNTVNSYSNDNFTLVKLQVIHHSEPRGLSGNVLHYACINGHLEMAKWMMRRFEICVSRRTFIRCCAYGRVNVIDWILAGKIVDGRKQSFFDGGKILKISDIVILAMSVDGGNVNVIKYFIERYKDEVEAISLIDRTKMIKKAKIHNKNDVVKLLKKIFDI